MNKPSTALFTVLLLSLAVSVSAQQTSPARFPADKATAVNPDTHLVLTFNSPPTLGTSGQIRIYDASNNKLVDTLDLSIPPGPARGGGRGGAGGGAAAGAGRGGAVIGPAGVIGLSPDQQTALQTAINAAKTDPSIASLAKQFDDAHTAYNSSLTTVMNKDAVVKTILDNDPTLDAANWTPQPAFGGFGAPGAGGRGAPGAVAAGGRGGAGAPPPFNYVYNPTKATNANTIPGTASSSLPATPPIAQLTIIGGFSDGFHFYPVIIHDNTATNYPHNNLLDYNKTYYVQIDPGVLTTADGSFTGISGNTAWTFKTKASPPPANSARLVVSGDGSGDFNTVQGAVDFIPDKNPKRVTIYIKNGTYEEIVYFRNKTNITFLGEDRKKVIVGYPNNENFNLQPQGTTSSERIGTFPYRRTSFMADNSSSINILNLTLHNFTGKGGGQSESLLLMGGKNIVSNVDLYGNQDTIQFNDSVYVTDTYIEGDTDFLWGRGPAFFNNCDFKQLANASFMFIRSIENSHGFVFQNCKFETNEGSTATLGRNAANFPYSEVVLLNCAIGPIKPVAWSLPGDTSNMHYWEYNSTNISDGKPTDTSERLPASKQLTKETDAETITNYSNPAFVLGGWTPELAPTILSQPTAITTPAGKTATLSATAAAIPAAKYQWQFKGAPLKDGTGVSGATTPTLTISNVQAANIGKYALVVTNSLGTATSEAADLKIGAVAAP